VIEGAGLADEAVVANECGCGDERGEESATATAAPAPCCKFWLGFSGPEIAVKGDKRRLFCEEAVAK